MGRCISLPSFVEIRISCYPALKQNVYLCEFLNYGINIIHKIDNWRHPETSSNCSWLGRWMLSKKSFPREDYRELVELTVLFLCGEISWTIRIRKAGANHNARFMAYAIYFLKLQMMSERFQMSQNERTEVNFRGNFS